MYDPAQTQFPMDKIPQYETRYTKSTRTESREYPWTHFTEDNFLNRTPMAQLLRSRIKWDFMGLKSFLKSNDTISRTKWQPTNWEMLITIPISYRRLVSKIYKELEMLDSNNPNNPIKIWVAELNWILNRGISNGQEALNKMLNIHTCQGNASQKDSKNPPHTHQNSQDQKLKGKHMLAKLLSKGNILPLLIWLQTCTSTL